LILTLCCGGEEASEGGAEIAGGHVAGGEVIGDVLAGGCTTKGLRFLAGVEGAEIGMVGGAGMRHLRPSTNMKQHKDARSLERMVDIEVSRRKIRFWDFSGSLAEARRRSLRE
jgi:hypothetical protein